MRTAEIPLAATTDPDPWLLAAVIWADEGAGSPSDAAGARFSSASELEPEEFLPRWQAIWRAVREAHECDPERLDFPCAVHRAATKSMSNSEAARRLVDLYELAYQFGHRLAMVSRRVHEIRERATRDRARLAAGGVAGDLGVKHPDTYGLDDAAMDLETIAADVRSSGLTECDQLPGLLIDDDCLALRWIPTGWNEAQRGFEDDGSLVVVGARTGGGKSTIALNLARLWCEKEEDSGAVVYWSCEMGRRTLTRRLLSAVSHIPEDDWGRPGSQEAIRKAQARLSDLGQRLVLFGPDDASFDIRTIINRTRAISNQQKIGLLIVDYGQQVQVRHERTSSDVERLTRVSNELQALSRELQAVTFIPVQLNRNASGVDAEPRLEHIRSCGTFEQDADQVWLLSHEDRGPGRRALKVHRAKMRNGQPDEFWLDWNMSLCRLDDQAPEQTHKLISQDFL